MFNATSDLPRNAPSTLVLALAVLTIGGLTACGGGGQDDGTASDTAAAESNLPSAGPQAGAMTEIRQVQKEIRAISKRAMQDSTLQRQLEDVRAMIDSTMRQMSADARAQMNRMDTLRSQLQTAQAEGDTSRFQTLLMEAQKLRRALQKVRSKAMQQEDVAAALKDFQNALRQQMREIDPAADSLMARRDSLQRQMQQQMQGMMGGDTAAADTAGG